MDIGRTHDEKEIRKGLKSKDPLMRKVANNAREKIRRQTDGWTRSARAKLIDETLKGNKDNTKQIRDDMVRHRGGRMGKGNRGTVETTAFHMTKEQYERIYGRHDI